MPPYYHPFPLPTSSDDCVVVVYGVVVWGVVLFPYFIRVWGRFGQFELGRFFFREYVIFTLCQVIFRSFLDSYLDSP